MHRSLLHKGIAFIGMAIVASALLAINSVADADDTGLDLDPVSLDSIASVPPMPCGGAAPLDNGIIKVGNNIEIDQLPIAVPTQKFINNPVGGIACAGSDLSVTTSSASVIFPATKSSLSLSNNVVIAPAGSVISVPGNAHVKFFFNPSGGSVTLNAIGSITAPDGSTISIPQNGTIMSRGNGNIRVPAGSFSSSEGPLPKGATYHYSTSFSDILDMSSNGGHNSSLTPNGYKAVTLTSEFDLHAPNGFPITIPAHGALQFYNGSQVRLPGGSTAIMPTGKYISGAGYSYPETALRVLPVGTTLTYPTEVTAIAQVKPEDIFNFPEGGTIKAPSGASIIIPTNSAFLSLGSGRIQLADQMLLESYSKGVPTETVIPSGTILNYPNSPTELDIITNAIKIPGGSALTLASTGYFTTPQTPSLAGPVKLQLDLGTTGKLSVPNGGVTIDPYGNPLNIQSDSILVSLGSTTDNDDPKGCKTNGEEVGCLQLPDGRVLSYNLKALGGTMLSISTRH